MNNIAARPLVASLSSFKAYFRTALTYLLHFIFTPGATFHLFCKSLFILEYSSTPVRVLKQDSINFQDRRNGHFLLMSRSLRYGLYFCPLAVFYTVGSQPKCALPPHVTPPQGRSIKYNPVTCDACSRNHHQVSQRDGLQHCSVRLL